MELRRRRLGLRAVLTMSALVAATLIGGVTNASEASVVGPSAASAVSAAFTAAGGGGYGGGGGQVGADEGAAFAMTNATADNRIVRYQRGSGGTLNRVGSISTRGLGIGVDLDTQGPLRLSADHKFLYAVNAGSDDVTVFSVNGTELRFVQKVYAGDQPVSLTVHGSVLYVLDGSVASNSIRGFSVGADGRLRPIDGSIQPLSSPIAVPGDIEFSPDGSLILVTQKTTANTLSPTIAIDSFTVNAHGVASKAKRNESAGIRPFALAFRNNHQALVVESFDASAGLSAVSSYDVRDRNLRVNSKSVPSGQTDACWIVITHDDGQFAFTANFGSGTISSYRIRDSGSIDLQRDIEAFTGATSQPVDLAQTDDSKYLYLLLRGTGGVASFAVNGGALTQLGVTIGGLPVADGASGLAVY